MQKGLTEVVTPYLEGKGWNGRPDAFVTWWRRTHFENSMIDALLHREHTPYREIGHRAVAYTLERAGIPYTMDEVRFLVAQIERLKSFPDVPAALARLNTRYKIVVLSNGDPDICSRPAESFHKIAFDAVISVAAANSFKPHVATYSKAAELMGVGMDEVLFVANQCTRLHRGKVRGHAYGILACAMPAITANCLSGFGSRLKNSMRSSKPAMPSNSPRIIIVGTVIFAGSTSGSFEHMST